MQTYWNAIHRPSDPALGINSDRKKVKYERTVMLITKHICRVEIDINSICRPSANFEK